ncbi:hypothetical protein [Glutamicibacter sp. NPDC087344]|uniref:hypothetical protein n=1 Tax=Glutamicibacter sp. NPDC087344 TaxID=3363994 RepID=UPI00380F9BBE
MQHYLVSGELNQLHNQDQQHHRDHHDVDLEALAAKPDGQVSQPAMPAIAV